MENKDYKLSFGTDMILTGEVALAVKGQISIESAETADTIEPYTANTNTLGKGDTEVKDGVKEYLKGQGFTEESIDQYFSDYDKMVDEQNQEMKSGRNYALKPLKVFGDIVESGSDNKVVKYAIKTAGYIGDAADIFTSDYPGDKTYSIVTGMAMGGMAGNVVGTAFTVLSYSGSGFVPVVVISGTVQEELEEDGGH